MISLLSKRPNNVVVLSLSTLSRSLGKPYQLPVVPPLDLASMVYGIRTDQRHQWGKLTQTGHNLHVVSPEAITFLECFYRTMSIPVSHKQ